MNQFSVCDKISIICIYPYMAVWTTCPFHVGIGVTLKKTVDDCFVIMFEFYDNEWTRWFVYSNHKRVANKWWIYFINISSISNSSPNPTHSIYSTHSIHFVVRSYILGLPLSYLLCRISSSHRSQGTCGKALPICSIFITMLPICITISQTF